MTLQVCANRIEIGWGYGAVPHQVILDSVGGDGRMNVNVLCSFVSLSGKRGQFLAFLGIQHSESTSEQIK